MILYSPTLFRILVGTGVSSKLFSYVFLCIYLGRYLCSIRTLHSVLVPFLFHDALSSPRSSTDPTPVGSLGNLPFSPTLHSTAHSTPVGRVPSDTSQYGSPHHFRGLSSFLLRWVLSCWTDPTPRGAL